MLRSKLDGHGDVKHRNRCRCSYQDSESPYSLAPSVASRLLSIPCILLPLRLTTLIVFLHVPRVGPRSSTAWDGWSTSAACRVPKHLKPQPFGNMHPVSREVHGQRGRWLPATGVHRMHHLPPRHQLRRSGRRDRCKAETRVAFVLRKGRSPNTTVHCHETFEHSGCNNAAPPGWGNFLAGYS